jgi:integrase
MPYAEKRGDGPFPWRARWLLPPNGDGKKHYDSEPGFATDEDALEFGRKKEQEQEVDLRRGTYRDPKRGEITVDDYFWKKWLPAQTFSQSSADTRAGEYRTHIKPRWGSTPLNGIDSFDVGAFERHMYSIRAESTAGNVMDLLRFMLDDAAHADLIPRSPMLPRQRGSRGARKPKRTRPGRVATIAEVLAICDRLTQAGALMTLTTLFTGMRWGEVAGMRRGFLVLHPAAGARPASGHYVIDPDIGAVHEQRSGRRLFAHPKGHKGRTVELPPFLVEILLAHLEAIGEERQLLFVNSRGGAYNHSSFDNKHWRPACDGWAARKASYGTRGARDAAPAVHKGLWFHDLRHTHKTWLADDGCEPIARDERLGHATPGMDGVYIHPTPAMRARILDVLQARWDAAAPNPSPKWLPKSGK